MQIRNSDQAYGAAAQALHWATVLLVILAWTLGTFDDALPKGAAHAAGLFVHISAGLVIPALLILRLLLRVVDPPPALEPTRLGKWAEVTARLAHYSMYALLIAVPVTGILAQFARGNPLPVAPDRGGRTDRRPAAGLRPLRNRLTLASRQELRTQRH